MVNKVSRYVEKYHMLAAGDTVVAGVSGGADSVCLLLVLSELKKQIPFHILVVHVNHMIRGEAERDASYVKDLCARLQVPFFLVQEDVQALAEKNGISTEEAGRQVRYESFMRVLSKEAPQALRDGKAKIAVAHNLNDRGETMLFHLFRGSGLSGLCSIRPVKNRKGLPPVIRPLLGLHRSEIEDYLSEKQITWCIDSTNAEDTYTRNRIRHHILPYAEEAVSSGVLAHMGRTADILEETEDFVQKETGLAYAVCAAEKPGEAVPEETESGERICASQDVQGIAFSIEKFLSYHVLLQKHMLLQGLEKLTPARKDVTATHVEDILKLFLKDGNREIHLPYGLTARREYRKVILERSGKEKRTEGGPDTGLREVRTEGNTADRQCAPITVVLPKPGDPEVYIPLSETEGMIFSVFSYEKTMDIPQNQYTKWFSYDKISKSLTLRNRQTGDYFTFNTALDKKTVQDYMVEAKIPKWKRDSIPVLADGQQVLWIVGYRIGSYYKVDEQTKYILQVQFRGGQ